MKNFIKPVLILCLLAFTVTGCKKDSSKKTNTAVTASVTASNFGFDGAGGSAFTASIATMVKAGPTLTITAIQGSTHAMIVLVLINVTGPATFKLDKGNADSNEATITKDSTNPGAVNSIYTTDNSGGGVNGGGQVVITKLTDTEAEGTFNIVAYNDAGKAAFVEQGKFSGKINK